MEKEKYKEKGRSAHMGFGLECLLRSWFFPMNAAHRERERERNYEVDWYARQISSVLDGPPPALLIIITNIV
jgi:hypothetical protein